MHLPRGGSLFVSRMRYSTSTSTLLVTIPRGVFVERVGPAPSSPLRDTHMAGSNFVLSRQAGFTAELRGNVKTAVKKALPGWTLLFRKPETFEDEAATVSTLRDYVRLRRENMGRRIGVVVSRCVCMECFEVVMVRYQVFSCVLNLDHELFKGSLLLFLPFESCLFPVLDHLTGQPARARCFNFTSCGLAKAVSSW